MYHKRHGHGAQDRAENHKANNGAAESIIYVQIDSYLRRAKDCVLLYMYGEKY